MKIVLITPITPYKENRGGATGLPYHLLIERPKGLDVIIYSFNRNRLSEDMIKMVEHNLNVKIRLLNVANWINWIIRLRLSFVRAFFKYPVNYYCRLKKPILDEIENLKPDLIWGYTQEFSGILKQFSNYKRLHTLPDCYSLHFYRRMALRSTMKNIVERYNVLLNYIKHYRMESEYDDSSNIIYHLVGSEDKNFLLKIRPNLSAYFINHPHYEFDLRRTIHFHYPKIRLLVAGRFDLYNKEMSDELLGLIAKLPQTPSEGVGNNLRNSYTFTFLGKGWEHHAANLAAAGYEVKHITFAPNYIEEITRHDIQLSPISIGTGTKGKVLDAFANGLLVLGTHFALENIAVEHGRSCIEWTHAEEVPEILLDIAAHREHYERIAEAGREAVLREHNPAKVSDELFKMVTL